jgi:hypothetical protein
LSKPYRWLVGLFLKPLRPKQKRRAWFTYKIFEGACLHIYLFLFLDIEVRGVCPKLNSKLNFFIFLSKLQIYCRNEIISWTYIFFAPHHKPMDWQINRWLRE